MTNRRRSGKGRTSASKKSETPDKHSRKVTRRGKRSKKSESPDIVEEVESEYSGEEQIDEDENKKIDGEKENEGFKDGNISLEMAKINDDQRSQLKEEESGGSDGSWKVKSENGGGGGIPKLKLCLTRPPETSSPTSTLEQNPSPRRRRRTAKYTPTKEDQVEEPVVEECTKRVTRNQKSKGVLEHEVVTVEKSEHAVELEPQYETRKVEEKEICNSDSCRFNDEERETRMAVESICHMDDVEDKKCGPIEERQDQAKCKEKFQEFDMLTEQQEAVNTCESQFSIETIKKQEVESEKNNDEQAAPKSENMQDYSVESECKLTSQSEIHLDSEILAEAESKQEIESQKVTEERPVSRDSSEERAKEAALRSRNKNKKRNEPDDDVIRMSKTEIFKKMGENNEILQSNESSDKCDCKENVEESIPTKSSARKRRWGSSASKTTKKPSVSISTDFLKEIIPEVKPLLLSEVQLSPNEEDEEGQLKDSDENLPVVSKKPDREKIIQSDESEKDYEEEAIESGLDESINIETLRPAPPVKEKEFTTFTRKVSVLSSNERLQKYPSPPRQKPSNILYIVNLVRPFTIPQLRELLARTGSITENGFWIDKIKSKCYVKYETEEEARTTRHALHGVRWPVSNPKQLNVDFSTEAAMKSAMEGNDISAKRPIPSLFDKQIDIKTNEKSRERERDKGNEKKERHEKDKKDRGKHREDDKREEDEDRDKKLRPPVEPLVRDKTIRRVTMPVREWDVGKNEDGFSPPPDGMEFIRHRDDRYERRVEYDRDKRDEYDDRRRREKDRNRRSVSGEPPRKSKKKSDEETPAKLLDDLFRKTKATPCIYWLPLTPEQISVKEEMRRKHMAEHEKKVAELRKIQREQSKRNSDKRRRRTKSRSKSRSVKK